jgi:hypothetical protein
VWAGAGPRRAGGRPAVWRTSGAPPLPAAAVAGGAAGLRRRSSLQRGEWARGRRPAAGRRAQAGGGQQPGAPGRPQPAAARWGGADLGLVLVGLLLCGGSGGGAGDIAAGRHEAPVQGRSGQRAQGQVAGGDLRCASRQHAARGSGGAGRAALQERRLRQRECSARCAWRGRAGAQQVGAAAAAGRDGHLHAALRQRPQTLGSHPGSAAQGAPEHKRDLLLRQPTKWFAGQLAAVAMLEGMGSPWDRGAIIMCCDRSQPAAREPSRNSDVRSRPGAGSGRGKVENVFRNIVDNGLQQPC